MIQYTTITTGCCGNEKTFSIPIGATAYEISEITGVSFSKAVELYESRIAEDPEKCPTIYYNDQISKTFTKLCLYGDDLTTNLITVPANMFSSQLSKADANKKAQDYLESLGEAELSLLECDENCDDCPDYKVIETKECGEYRINQVCSRGNCVPYGNKYFVCTGDCDNENCVEPCIECSALCPEGTCPETYYCLGGVCIKDCNNQPCSKDCPEGFCVDPCEECRGASCQPIICPQGQECKEGECVPIECNPNCTYVVQEIKECYEVRAFQDCVNGECENNGYTETVYTNNGQPCSGGTCENGECVPDCLGEGGSTCPDTPCCDGLDCVQGTCTSSPCSQGCTTRGFDIDPLSPGQSATFTHNNLEGITVIAYYFTTPAVLQIQTSQTGTYDYHRCSNNSGTPSFDSGRLFPGNTSVSITACGRIRINISYQSGPANIQITRF